MGKVSKDAADTTQVATAKQLNSTLEQVNAEEYNARIGSFTKEKVVDGTTLWYEADDYDVECNSYRLNYFYFGDLLDVVADIVSKNNKDEIKDIYYVLASFAFPEKGDPTTGRTTLVPLASIPISLNYFTDWMIKNVVAEQKPVYFLLDFIRNFIDGALIKSFGAVLKRYNVDKKDYSVQFGYKVVTLPPNTLKRENQDPSDGNQDKESGGRWSPATPLRQHELKSMLWGKTQRSTLARQSAKPIRNEAPQHCVILYPYTYDLESLNGKYSEDVKNGVYHLGLGQDHGIVNQIAFNKNEVKFMSETAFMRAGDSFGQMKRIYNATVTTMGNTLFYPGSVVYLNPSIPGLGSPSGNGVLAQMGLGGYYTVNKVSFELTRHDFETTLHCIWRASGDGASAPKPEVRRQGSAQ